MINSQKLGTASGRVALAAALAFGATSALAIEDCGAPEKPMMPDGSTATMEQMLEGQKAVKTFQADLKIHLECLDEHMAAAEDAASKTDDEEAKATHQAAYNEAFNAYNAAVSSEEEVAGDFNVALRAYKAANK
ncbi:MAG: hypothetical protein AAGG55_15995 [Pseudomonadota bacterium]